LPCTSWQPEPPETQKAFFIGTKMYIVDFYKIPVAVSLGMVVTVLALTMWLGVRNPPAGSHLPKL